MVSEVNAANGWSVVIHVDGASGAFVAPFLYPDLEWDFRLKNVASINVSGHKYGLVSRAPQPRVMGLGGSLGCRLAALYTCRRASLPGSAALQQR